MWIRKCLNGFVITLLCTTLLLTGCHKPINVEIQKYSQQDIDKFFNEAITLIDNNKPDDAYKILKQLAEQGDPKSQTALGSGYEHGLWGDVTSKKPNIGIKNQLKKMMLELFII